MVSVLCTASVFMQVLYIWYSAVRSNIDHDVDEWQEGASLSICTGKWWTLWTDYQTVSVLALRQETFLVKCDTRFVVACNVRQIWTFSFPRWCSNMHNMRLGILSGFYCKFNGLSDGERTFENWWRFDKVTVHWWSTFWDGDILFSQLCLVVGHSDCTGQWLCAL